MEHNIIDIPLDQSVSNTIPVTHANITASFFKLDTRPTHSDIVFFPTTAKEWNALPSNIISSNSIESFQKNLNKYLIDH